VVVDLPAPFYCFALLSALLTPWPNSRRKVAVVPPQSCTPSAALPSFKTRRRALHRGDEAVGAFSFSLSVSVAQTTSPWFAVSHGPPQRAARPRCPFSASENTLGEHARAQTRDIARASGASRAVWPSVPSFALPSSMTSSSRHTHIMAVFY
jgi:hypothetical protein